MQKVFLHGPKRVVQHALAESVCGMSATNFAGAPDHVHECEMEHVFTGNRGWCSIPIPAIALHSLRKGGMEQ